MRLSAPALILLVAPGCANTSFTSDGGQLRFETAGVTAGAITNIDPHAEVVLEGTTLCATVCRDDGSDCNAEKVSWAEECFTDTLVGPASFDGECVRFDAPGEVRWAWEPESCSEATDHVADGIDFTVVGVEEVTARRAFPMDEFVTDAIAASPYPDGSAWSTSREVPDDALPVEDEPVLWMVGGTAEASVALQAADGRPVIWSVAAATIDVTATEGPDPAFTTTGTAGVLVSPEEPGEGDLLFDVSGDEWSLGRWQAVDESEAAALEIVVVYADDATSTQPVGARAIVRDAAGRPIFGAPVDWGVDGEALGVGVSDEGAGDRSYANLDGAACLTPSEREGEHATVLQARLGDLSDEIEVTWQLAALGYTDEELAAQDAAWTVPDTCLDPIGPACGCATREPSGALAAALAGLIAMGRRYSRRARPSRV